MPYNTSINNNISDWKQYDLETLTLNDRSLYEIEIDTSDATMMGTEHSSNDAGYVTSRFQVRMDNDSIKLDAFKQCKDPNFILRNQYPCSETLYEDYTTIMNNLINDIYSNLDTTDPNFV